jgi:exopolysaccharide production protein ExoQ
MNRILVNAEKIFTVISLIHYAGGPLVLILSGGESEGDNSPGITSYPLIQLLFFLNFACSFVLLTLRWKNVFYVLSKDRFISTLLGVSILSVLWSTTPSVTIIRNTALVGSSLFGLYLASRYSLKEQLQLLAWSFGIAIVLSWLFVVILPKYGIMAGIHTGKWRGIFTHKNVLGKLMILSSMIFLLTALNERKNKLLLWGGLGLSVLLLLMSGSSSAIVSFVIIGIIFLLIKLVRMPYILMAPTIFSIAALGLLANIWLMNNSGNILSSLGKDATLTGRLDIWPAVLDKIWQQPWLGYGFSGFWGSDWSSESAYVWNLTGWTPPNAHNGLLDLWLDLGLLGLSVFLIGFFINLVKGLIWVRLSKSADAFWPVMYIVYFWLSNQTESALLRQNEIYWLLYVTAVFSLCILPVKNSSTYIQQT